MSIVTYSSPEFEEKYTYHGNDLGALWSREATRFRVWAPTADEVRLNLYASGDGGEPLESLPMSPAENGTWTLLKQGDLNGVYYTYTAVFSDNEQEACDPYARTTGVNGRRAMVMDLSSADPDHWDTDRDPHWGKPITDAVIYELHIRDLSMDPHSGITHKGKFLGLTEHGTFNSKGVPTGIDHIRGLGVTHVHLLPVFDFGSVDEAAPSFNWGYDPMNFNVPEGSYATDPFHGEVRVREMKQMVKSLHDSGLSVIMDVVYNHVFDAGSFCFNRLVPGCFSRVDGNGEYSNGSCCGNDTASERSMVRKYIVDSVCYWADEYHIDGFRFDLVGLIDVQTIQEVMEAVHRRHPNVIFYGEGWDMATKVTKPGVDLAVQANSHLLPGFGFFSDTLRDCLKGSVFFSDARGFISGGRGEEETLKKCFLGLPDWCASPDQSINYVSCHDNATLFDRLILSAPEASFADRVKMNRLAAAICMTAQGVPFFQAGEEMLRTKDLDENSYCSPDSVNALRWEDLNREDYRAVREYYKGLIAFRKAHPALRMTDTAQVRAAISSPEGLGDGLAAFHVSGKTAGDHDIYCVFNANTDTRTVPLPAGTWQLCVTGEKAGTVPQGIAKKAVSVPPVSAAVLVRKPGGPKPAAIAATAAALTTLTLWALRKKKK